MRGGHMIGAENYALDGAGDQSAAQILGSFIMQFYDDGRQPPSEILCMELPEQAEDIALALSERKGAKVTVFEPQRGTKHKLVELALKNAKDALAKRNAHLAVRTSAPSAHVRRWPRRSAWITRRGASKVTIFPTRRAF